MTNTVKSEIRKHIAEIDHIEKTQILPLEEKVIDLLLEEYPMMSRERALDYACDVCYNSVSLTKVLKLLDKIYK